MSTALVIHGHFYQPPRESPWTGEVDREPSAHPFHDWNERIHAECYRANAFARILDGFGRVSRIVNNYARISFNVGPTLLSWLERHAPPTYEAILAADRASAKENGGHGNAIAQGYNHVILPLCNDRDRRTQVRWGLADFRHRFGREAEAMWLPETACNAETLDTLIEEGMRYVILSPHQAEAVRAPGTDRWRSVADGSVDPGVPYRAYHTDGSGRSIAAFFYDGPIARAFAFDGAVRTSQALLGTLSRGAGGEGRLVHVATDGESYGHHARHAERTLAHALDVEAPARGFAPTNYGAFLDRHPPVIEVKLKPGPNGEGTAWSCAHGVGRWYRDCGCQTGAREGFTQEWRTPLRRALDLLRDEAARVFEETTGELFEDAWAARDAYIELMLDPGASRDAWLRRFSKGELSQRDRTRALTHLEVQRNAQLMYTSCGWFFSDISGIETVQILKYAGRALDLMDELGLDSPRDAFLAVLGEARSNFAEMGTGADVFDRFVEPLRVSGTRIAAHLAITSLVAGFQDGDEKAGYRVGWSHARVQRHGRLTMGTGRLTLEHRATGERLDHAFAAMHLGGVDFYCVLRAFPGTSRFHAATTRLWSSFRTASLPAMLRIAREELGPDEHGLESVLPEDRQKIAGLVFGDVLGGFTDTYVRLYESSQRLLEMLQEAGFDLPPEIAAAAEMTLSRRFDHAMELARGSLDEKDYARAIEVAEEAARHGYRIDQARGAAEMERLLEAAMEAYRAEPSAALARPPLDVLALAKRLRLEPSLERAQEIFFGMTSGKEPTSDEASALARALGFAHAARHERAGVGAAASRA